MPKNTRRPRFKPVVNDTKLDYKSKWVVRFESPTEQIYECRWDGTHAHCVTLDDNDKPILTLEPLTQQGFEVLFKKLAQKVYKFQNLTK